MSLNISLPMRNHVRFATTRHGTTITELIVACVVLASLMAYMVPMVIRIGHVQQASRHDRIAMDELSNQLDRLSMLEFDELATSLEQVQASDFARESLRNPRLQGQLKEAHEGRQLTLTLHWQSYSRGDKALSLTTWIYPVVAHGVALPLDVLGMRGSPSPTKEFLP